MKWRAGPVRLRASRYSFVLIANRAANAAGLREHRRCIRECQLRQRYQSNSDRRAPPHAVPPDFVGIILVKQVYRKARLTSASGQTWTQAVVTAISALPL
jgi:hypothetical protein